MLAKRSQDNEIFVGKAARFVAFLICYCLVSVPGQSTAAPIIDYVESALNHNGAIIDTRPASICQKASLAGARCLPAQDFFAAHKRLANFSGILWLLGTSGLTGSEHVLVIGDKSPAKEAIGGLLLVTGQNKVSILAKPVDTASINKPEPGDLRSSTREEVFQAQMRSERMVLASELVSQLRSTNPPILLDARSEAEYWGARINAWRGGHIPGALHQPIKIPATDQLNELSFSIADKDLPVAYAHNAYQGLIYLARLEAYGQPARLFLEGWAGWASDGTLPADAQSFSEQRLAIPSTLSQKSSGRTSGLNWLKIAGYSVAGFSVIFGSFIAGRAFASTGEKT